MCVEYVPQNDSHKIRLLYIDTHNYNLNLKLIRVKLTTKFHKMIIDFKNKIPSTKYTQFQHICL